MLEGALPSLGTLFILIILISALRLQHPWLEQLLMADTHLSISLWLPANYKMRSFGEAIRTAQAVSVSVNRRESLVAASACPLVSPQQNSGSKPRANNQVNVCFLRFMSCLCCCECPHPPLLYLEASAFHFDTQMASAPRHLQGTLERFFLDNKSRRVSCTDGAHIKIPIRGTTAIRFTLY